MGKILVLGNNESSNWAKDLQNSIYIQMPILSLGEDGECKLSQFIIDNMSDDIDACALDVDKISNPELCLAFAMALRLSIFELKRKALMPILFVSSTTQDIYHGYKFSSIILTGSVAFEIPGNAVDALEVMPPMTPEEYKTSFLDIIKIQPNATEGRHSLANQWGADVLHRIVLGTATDNQLIQKARRSLYFKYVLSLTLKAKDIYALLNGENPSEVSNAVEPIDAKGKRVLLIDDEADKGWDTVINSLLKGAHFKCICEHSPNYEGLSDNARFEIESGNYDIIFLDLRMNGISEENVLNPNDFSGMKILKEIKKINRGTQVIMLTASNKAWNMKALFDAGADGYYIKESPEFAFSQSYSLSNAKDLLANINSCLKKDYLRDIYLKIKKIKQLINDSNCYGERTEEILSSIDIAYDLLAKSEDNNEYKAYSYLQLFLVIEEYVNNPSVFDLTDYGFYLYNGNKRYRILIKEKRNNANNLITYDSKISMNYGHYLLKVGKYYNRFIDTNFRVSALLIYKFGQENSSYKEWTTIYKARNEKAAHPKTEIILVDDFYRILDFMIFFFDSANNNWRNPNQAFPDISEKDKMNMLLEKYNKK